MAEQVVDDGFLQEFFSAAEENLDQLEQALIRLEALGVPALENGTLVALATWVQELKEGAGFLGWQKFFTLAAAGEPLLAALMQGIVPLTTPVVDALLNMTETLKELLILIKAQADDDAVEIEELVKRLVALAVGQKDVVIPVATAKGVKKVVPTVKSVQPEAEVARLETVADSVVKQLVDTLVGPLLPRQGRETAWVVQTLERRQRDERRRDDRRQQRERREQRESGQ